MDELLPVIGDEDRDDDDDDEEEGDDDDDRKSPNSNPSSVQVRGRRVFVVDDRTRVHDGLASEAIWCGDRPSMADRNT
jgi:hypothetical protein